MGVWLAGIFPKLAPFLPRRLLDGMALLQRVSGSEDYYISIMAAGAMIILCVALAVVYFDRREL